MENLINSYDSRNKGSRSLVNYSTSKLTKAVYRTNSVDIYYSKLKKLSSKKKVLIRNNSQLLQRQKADHNLNMSKFNLNNNKIKNSKSLNI